MKRQVVLVGNRLRAGTRTADELERYFAGREPALLTLLRDSQLYPALAQAGTTVFESGGARARPYAEEWQPLLELIGIEAPVGRKSAAYSADAMQTVMAKYAALSRPTLAPRPSRPMARLLRPSWLCWIR